MLRPAWKVALLTFVVLFVGTIVVAGVSGGFSSDNPYDKGRKVGDAVAPLLLLAPLLAYIVQKTRIDRANRKR